MAREWRWCGRQGHGRGSGPGHGHQEPFSVVRRTGVVSGSAQGCGKALWWLSGRFGGRFIHVPWETVPSLMGCVHQPAARRHRCSRWSAVSAAPSRPGARRDPRRSSHRAGVPGGCSNEHVARATLDRRDGVKSHEGRWPPPPTASEPRGPWGEYASALGR